MKKILLTSFCVAFLSATAGAQLLSFNTTGNLGTETTEPSVFNNASVLASSLTLGSGITPAANVNRFGGSNFFDAGDTNPTTLAESIAGNDFFQFIVTPAAAATFTATSFVFSFDHSASGPNSFTLRSSVDNFASDLGSVTGLAANLTTNNTIALTTFNDVASAVTFRLYGYGATSSAGTGGFDTTTNALSPNVVLVPEPSTKVMIIGALGLAALVYRRKAGVRL